MGVQTLKKSWSLSTAPNVQCKALLLPYESAWLDGDRVNWERSVCLWLVSFQWYWLKLQLLSIYIPSTFSKTSCCILFSSGWAISPVVWCLCWEGTGWEGMIWNGGGWWLGSEIQLSTWKRWFLRQPSPLLVLGLCPAPWAPLNGICLYLREDGLGFQAAFYSTWLSLSTCKSHVRIATFQCSDEQTFQMCLCAGWVLLVQRYVFSSLQF